VSSDEISLIDLWCILAGRKTLVLLVFIAVMLIAVGYLLLADPLYESKVVVRVGQVGKYIEDVSEIRQRLMAEHPMLTSVGKSKSGADNIFTLTMQKNDKLQAEQELRRITDKLLGDHSIIFAKAIDPIRQRIETLQAQYRENENQIGELNTQIERYKVKEPAQTTILVMEKNYLSLSIANIEDRIANLQKDIAGPNIAPTRLLGVQTTTEEPIKPNRKVVIALAVISGLMLGFFAVFIAEFFAHVRKAKAVKQDK
jgi:uncharacterized protein involved in exopolysaccharide biosynthesis